jgi:hypothetical protein
MLVDGPDSETTIRFVPYSAFQQSYLTRGVRGPDPMGAVLGPNPEARSHVVAYLRMAEALHDDDEIALQLGQVFQGRGDLVRLRHAAGGSDPAG